MITPILKIIEQYAEEAPFLWKQRGNAIGAPHLLLKYLAGHDSRLEAYLDGLRVNGDPAWEMVKPLAAGDPGALFAATVLAIEGNHPDRVDFAIAAGISKPAMTRALISGLGWSRYERVKSIVAKLCESDNPAARRAGIAASAIHRQRPGAALNRAFADKDVLLVARACKAVGELGLAEGRHSVNGQLSSADETVRYWAAWAGTIAFGDAAFVNVLQAMAEKGGPFSENAARLAVRRMDPARAGAWWRQQLAGKLRRRRTAIVAAGAAGDPAAIPWIIQQMSVAKLARPAGEALAMITGVHLANEQLEGPKPENFKAGPNEDPADENVAMDADEHLAWPDQKAVEKWWSKKAGEYSPATRYLAGKPMTVENLQIVLRTGYQRQRAAAAMELAIRQTGTPLFEIRMPGYLQQESLGIITPR